MVLEADYSGLADYAMWPLYLDPNGFLDQFANDATGNPAGWSDPGYASELETANAVVSRPERLKKLAACESSVGLRIVPFHVATPGDVGKNRLTNNGKWLKKGG